MIGDYDTDGEVFPHTQAPIFKVCAHFRCTRLFKSETRFFGDHTTYNSLVNSGNHVCA